MVYAGSADEGLYAIEAATGKLHWKFDEHGDVNPSPAIAGDTVNVVSLDGSLYAVNVATDRQRWSFATRGEHRFVAAGNLGAHPSAKMMQGP